MTKLFSWYRKVYRAYHCENCCKLLPKAIFLKGFTLLELMVAYGILLIVISGLLLTFVYCLLLNESNNNSIIATNDAQYVLEQVKGLPYSDIASYLPPEFNNLHNETVVVTCSYGTWLSEVTVNISWLQRQRQRSLQFTTRIARETG